MQMTSKEYLQPDYLEDIKKEFFDKYEQKIPNLQEHIEDVFLEAVVIFTINYKSGRITRLKALVKDYIIAIMLKILIVDRPSSQETKQSHFRD